MTAEAAPPEPAEAASPTTRRSIAWIGALTAVGLVVSFLREILLARWLGPGRALDLFLTAQLVPLQLGRSVGEAVNQVLLPAYVKAQRQAPGSTRSFVARWLAFGALFTLPVAALMLLAIPVVVPLATPALDPAARAELVRMSWIMTPFVVVLFYAMTCKCLLDLRGRHAPGVLGPLALNLAVIAAAMAMAMASGSVVYLAWGSLVGGLAGLALVVVPLLLGPRPVVAAGQEPAAPGQAPALPLVPFFLTLGTTVVAALAVWVDLWFCLGLGDGKLSSLNLALLMVNIPPTCLAPVFQSVLFPRIARLVDDRGRAGPEEVLDNMKAIYRWSVLAGLVSAVPFVVAGQACVELLFAGPKLDAPLAAAIGLVAAILAPVPVASFMISLYRLVLTADLQQGEGVRVHLLALGVKVLVLLAAVPTLGLWGVALGVTIYNVALWAFTALGVRRRLGLVLPAAEQLAMWRPKVLLVLPAAAASWAVAAWALPAPADRLGAVVVLVASAALFVALVLLAQRWVRDDELGFLLARARR